MRNSFWETALVAPLLMSFIIGTALTTTFAQDEATEDLGKQVFTTEAAPNCGICHTLADAGAVGEIGPNLDDLMPSEERVRAAVLGGFEAMPSYEGVLTPEQIDAVAAYVAEVAGTGG